MTAYIHIVIGVLCVTRCSFSRNLNCMKLTTSCPNTAQWLDREKTFHCAGNKRYICLMTPGKELREGCIFNIIIQAGRIGCPCTMECDIRTGQPLLVTPNNYLPCPPDLDGCPPRNHSGYSILEIYRYARCQGRNSSSNSSVSPDEDTGTQTTNIPLETPKHVNWTIINIFIVVGFILILFLVIFIVRQRYQTPSDSISFWGTPLYKAVSNGDSDLVRTLIDSNADVNAIDWYQDTPLHKAASDGHIDIVKELINAEADVNAKNYSEETPLHMAVLNGHIEIVKTLINNKADINAKSWNNETSLHIAASECHLDTMKTRINAKADVNAKRKNGKTPLHLAVESNQSDVIKILLDADADINAKDKNKKTPLSLAEDRGIADIFKAIPYANVTANKNVKA